MATNTLQKWMNTDLSPIVELRQEASRGGDYHRHILNACTQGEDPQDLLSQANSVFKDWIQAKSLKFSFYTESQAATFYKLGIFCGEKGLELARRSLEVGGPLPLQNAVANRVSLRTAENLADWLKNHSPQIEGNAEILHLFESVFALFAGSKDAKVAEKFRFYGVLVMVLQGRQAEAEVIIKKNAENLPNVFQREAYGYTYMAKLAKYRQDFVLQEKLLKQAVNPTYLWYRSLTDAVAPLAERRRVLKKLEDLSTELALVAIHREDWLASHNYIIDLYKIVNGGKLNHYIRTEAGLAYIRLVISQDQFSLADLQLQNTLAMIFTTPSEKLRTLKILDAVVADFARRLNLRYRAYSNAQVRETLAQKLVIAEKYYRKLALLRTDAAIKGAAGQLVSEARMAGYRDRLDTVQHTLNLASRDPKCVTEPWSPVCGPSFWINLSLSKYGYGLNR